MICNRIWCENAVIEGTTLCAWHTESRTPKLKDEHRGSRAISEPTPERVKQLREEVDRLALERRREATDQLREELRADLAMSSYSVRERVRAELKELRERAADIMAQANRIEAILEDL